MATEPLPLVLTPGRDGLPEGRPDALAAWLEARRDTCTALLDRHGALAFRGFGGDNAEDFARIAAALSPTTFDDVGGISPRGAITRDVYESTVYPPKSQIEIHNEYATCSRWPRRLTFGCVVPAAHGGATTIADGRRILADLDADLRANVERHGLAYYWTFTPATYGKVHLFKSWPEAFGTHDRAEAEAHARSTGLECGWTGEAMFWTYTRQPGVVRHERSGEAAWFNQLALRLPSVIAYDDRFRAAIAAGPRSQGKLRWSSFGDGRAIEADQVANLRAVGDRNTVDWCWEKGDVLVLDNALVQHGRRPFEGERAIIVRMSA